MKRRGRTENTRRACWTYLKEVVDIFLLVTVYSGIQIDRIWRIDFLSFRDRQQFLFLVLALFWHDMTWTIRQKHTNFKLLSDFLAFPPTLSSLWPTKIQNLYYKRLFISLASVLPDPANFLIPICLVPMFINEPPTLIEELEPFFFFLKSETEPPTFSLRSRKWVWNNEGVGPLSQLPGIDLELNLHFKFPPVVRLALARLTQ